MLLQLTSDDKPALIGLKWTIPFFIPYQIPGIQYQCPAKAFTIDLVPNVRPAFCDASP